MAGFNFNKEIVEIHWGRKVISTVCRGAILVQEAAMRLWKGRQVWKGKEVWKY